MCGCDKVVVNSTTINDDDDDSLVFALASYQQ